MLLIDNPKPNRKFFLGEWKANNPGERRSFSVCGGFSVRFLGSGVRFAVRLSGSSVRFYIRLFY